MEWFVHPAFYRSTTLGKWCKKQRVDFQATFQANKFHLSQDHIDKLATIGFQFCLYDKKPKKNLKWNDRYNDLVDYKNEHGHANPPKRTQRTLFQNKMNKVSKNGLIYQHQIDKLVAIGFLFKLRLGKRTLQRANLPAIPDLPAWTFQPYRKCLLCRTCKLCHPWLSCQTAYLPYLMLLPSNKKRELGRAWAWCLVEYHHRNQCGQRKRLLSNISARSKLIW